MAISLASAGNTTGSTVPLTALGREDAHQVGAKAANLGELLRAGVRVPPGFVVPTATYSNFVAGHRLDEALDRLVNGLDPHDSSMLARVADRARELILSSPIAAAAITEIHQGYDRLGRGPVAVRSSAPAEDISGASFAGQYRTLLNVEGAQNVATAVRACWASLFQARAIFYRAAKGMPLADIDIAVLVQRMVPSDVSGVTFTADPSTGDGDVLLVEAVYGLGEPLAEGELSPDSYLVSREGLQIRAREISAQPWMLRRNTSGDGYDEASGRVPVSPALQRRQKLDDEQITEMADLGLRLERHFGGPQDIEWAWAWGQPHILQSRPITTPVGVNGHTSGRNGAPPPVISGAGASPGIAAGPTCIIHDASGIARVEPGDVLIAEMTTPDFVPAMKRAAAIVTNRGGRTCHAAIVSREMGIPCVVGTGHATGTLRDLPIVTVDGRAGEVYEGDVTAVTEPPASPPSAPAVQTRTKLYVNLADPDSAERVASRDVDGVGLLRAEFMVAHLGEHPRSMLESGRGPDFTDHLVNGLERFASAFAPRPVVYRFTDFKTNEYRNLKGGEAWEPHEENPMIGYRGSARYLSEPDLFALEVDALKKVRRRFTNLWAMLPFVRSVPELRSVAGLLRQHGLERGPDFKLWMMVEVPSNVFLLDQFLDAGVDGVSIGSNDLTQLVLGLDRDNERLASMFDERDPAVLRAIEHVVRTCADRGVTVSICGQAPSEYPELTRALVQWGVTSVSVTVDMIDETRITLLKAETS